MIFIYSNTGSPAQSVEEKVKFKKEGGVKNEIFYKNIGTFYVGSRHGSVLGTLQLSIVTMYCYRPARARPMGRGGVRVGSSTGTCASSASSTLRTSGRSATTSGQFI
jgi:hypothetical protein